MELLTAIYTTDIGVEPQLIGWWLLWFLRIGLAVSFAGGLYTGLRGAVRALFN